MAISKYNSFSQLPSQTSVGKRRHLLWHRQQPNKLVPQPPPSFATPTHCTHRHHVTTVAHGAHRPPRLSTTNSHHHQRCSVNANNQRGTHATSPTKQGTHGTNGTNDASHHHHTGPQTQQRHVTNQPSPPRSATTTTIDKRLPARHHHLRPPSTIVHE